MSHRSEASPCLSPPDCRRPVAAAAWSSCSPPASSPRAAGRYPRTSRPRPRRPRRPRPSSSTTAGPIAPALATEAVPDDPDDPAVWRHPTAPARSLILGTNKIAAPGGALVVFGLDGRIRQTIAGLDRPNNVDVEYGLALGDRRVDVAIVTERLQHRLRLFAIDADTGQLSDLASVPVLEGETGDRAEPMGIAAYRRPADGAVFAIVAPKGGGPTGYLAQYRLEGHADGTVTGTLVRRFGHFSERGPAPGEAGEIEAVVVDDALGWVYYADERYGIHKWAADPDSPDAGRELAVFGLEGYERDREGLAIYARPDGTGYLVSVDQIPGGSILRVYRREGRPGAPHDHSEVVGVIRTPADETDGLDVASEAFPGFPHGLVVMMNSGPRDFLVFDWEAVGTGLK
ncbi:MAG: phytase [Vicinamibacterales bacterium]